MRNNERKNTRNQDIVAIGDGAEVRNYFFIGLERAVWNLQIEAMISFRKAV